MLGILEFTVYFIVAVCAAAAIGCFFAKHPKYLAAVLAIVMLFGAYMAGSTAEELDTVVIEDYYVEAVIVNSEPLLLITFQHEGEYLSFYWEGKLDFCPLQITIWKGVEVIDAEYVKEQASA